MVGREGHVSRKVNAGRSCSAVRGPEASRAKSWLEVGSAMYPRDPTAATAADHSSRNTLGEPVPPGSKKGDGASHELSMIAPLWNNERNARPTKCRKKSTWKPPIRLTCGWPHSLISTASGQ